MKSWRLVTSCASLTLLLVGACAQPNHTPPAGTATAAEYDLSKQELAILEKQALNGDNDAAGRLKEFYWVHEGDNVKGHFWVQIGAENGHPGAEVEYAYLLESTLPERSEEQRRIEMERSCFWFRKALSDGFPQGKINRGDLIRCGLSK